jgi:dTDP-4-amino-4,6-dideoxygalactose transaminase
MHDDAIGSMDKRKESYLMDKQLAIHGGPRTIPEGFIQPSPPTTALDEEYVLKSLRGPSHAWGPNCDALQNEFAKWNGNKHCIAVTSGTAALHMALVAAGCAAGDEVITPAYSWTSSASCILHANCIPVFVDVDPLYTNLDPAKIEAAITPRTRAIIVVHLHGVPVDLDPILAIARKHKLTVIEDCCQAHGALYKGRKVGTIAPISAFSLNQNKMLSAGEGGLLVTDDDQLLERARSLVLFGDFRDPLPDANYRHYGTGYMYRYNDLCAAYARAQLTRLDESIAHSRTLFAVLRRGLQNLPGLVLPQEPVWGKENAYNFVCHVEPKAVGYRGPVNFFREAIVSALQAEGVPASVWQRRILPEMAAIAARNAFGNGSPWREHGSKVSYDPGRYPVVLSHTDSYFVIGGLRLPNTEELAERIVAAVRQVFTQLDKLDVDAIARKADVGFYERGWQKHAAKIK